MPKAGARLNASTHTLDSCALESRALESRAQNFVNRWRGRRVFKEATRRLDHASMLTGYLDADMKRSF